MIRAAEKIWYSHIKVKNRSKNMRYPLHFVNGRNILLLAGATFIMFSGTSVSAQEGDVPSDDVMMEQQAQPENIMGDAPGVEESEAATSAQAPSQEVLDDLDQQLENIQNMIDEANTDVDDSSLPAIDPLAEPDLYYDSMPVRRGVQPTAPEKVDPTTRPGGKIVHVQKDFNAGDDQAILVCRAYRLVP